MSTTAVLVIVALVVVVAVFVSLARNFDRETSGVLDKNGKYRKDPLRIFEPFVIFEAKRRCGHRCEYVTFFGRRCKNTEKDTALHADHWIPWSKGGATSEENIVMLCSHCNLAKSSELPFKWETKRLFASRLRYQINAMRPGFRYGQSRFNVDFPHAFQRERVEEIVEEEQDKEEINPSEFYKKYADNDD